jgi:hypothetical protein
MKVDVEIAQRPQDSDSGIRLPLASSWWAHPAAILLIWGPIGPIAAWATSSDSFIELWKTPKYFTATDLLVSLACLFVCATVTIICGVDRSRPARYLEMTSAEVEVVKIALRGLFYLTIFGYAMWAAIGMLHGVSVADVVHAIRGEAGSISALKRQIRPVAGITSCTQFGPLVVLLAALLRRAGAEPKARRYIGIIILLGLIRSVVYAERLAIFEVLAPLIVVHALFLPSSRQHKWLISVIRAAIPLIAPLVLLGVFALFEFNRSWTGFYKDTYNGSYASFAVTRLEGYYATASNNSALIERDFDKKLPLPYYTVQWAWTLPGVSKVVSYADATGVDPTTEWVLELQANANPEFNNEGGILTPAADYGTAGGVVYWALVGIFFGNIWRRVRRGSFTSICLLGISFVGLLEIGRFTYWSLGRFVPAVLGVLYLSTRLRQLKNANIESRNFDRVTATSPNRP